MSEKYFGSIEEFEEKYTKGNFEKMFVFRSIGGVIRLNRDYFKGLLREFL